jgi:sulfite exporter TauE/SafE
MCGPLAMAFCDKPEQSTTGQLIRSISYNLGRSTCYAFLGLAFGYLGIMSLMAGFQGLISILLGLAFLLSFVFAVNLENKINHLPPIAKFYTKVKSKISQLLANSKKYPGFYLGLLNGLLPCGLVYLALAGAISCDSVIESVLFMFLFGLGTMPMLFTLSLGYQMGNLKHRAKLQNILPYISLLFGLFLIYRGLAIEFPEQLNFWEAVQNPIMCH